MMIANFQVRLHIMSYVIAIFVGVGEWGFIEFPGGRVVKKRESPDFRSPEVGISEIDPFFFQVLIHVDPRPSSMTTDYRNSFNV